MTNLCLKYLENKKVMILIPHMDDEINLAGGLLYAKRFLDIDFRIVFITNGDYRGYYIGKKRMKEALRVGKMFGIDSSNIYFLGYPDCANGDKNNIFLYETEKMVSNVSRQETYGLPNHSEFCYKLKKHHNAYNCINLKDDLSQLMMTILPEIIIYNDLDFHAMHRVNSILIDEVLGKVLLQLPEYHPLVLKGFCYDLAWYAQPDYSNFNLKSTLKPEYGLINEFCIWDERIRIPMPKKSIGGPLCCNPIYKGLRKHHTQLAAMRANRIINSDICYWTKRTDNLLGRDIFIRSDEQGNLLYDFVTHYTKEVWKQQNEIICYNERNFSPKDDVLIFEVDENVYIEKIVLYTANDCEIKSCSVEMGKAELVFDNFENEKKYILNIGKSVNKGIIKIYNFKFCGNLSFSQIEILPKRNDEIWFLKIQINDTYAYRYYYDGNIQNISTIVYLTNGELAGGRDIKYKYFNRRGEEVVVDKITINKRCPYLRVRAFLKDTPSYFDEIEIIYLSRLRKILNYIINFGDKIVCKIEYLWDYNTIRIWYKLNKILGNK